MNQKLIHQTEDGAAFSETETAYLLNGVPKENMLDTTVAKLETLSIMEYVDVLGRNLAAIIKNQ
jgi:hypothetical protein